MVWTLRLDAAQREKQWSGPGNNSIYGFGSFKARALNFITDETSKQRWTPWPLLPFIDFLIPAQVYTHRTFCHYTRSNRPGFPWCCSPCFFSAQLALLRLGFWREWFRIKVSFVFLTVTYCFRPLIPNCFLAPIPGNPSYFVCPFPSFP